MLLSAIWAAVMDRLLIFAAPSIEPFAIYEPSMAPGASFADVIVPFAISAAVIVPSTILALVTELSASLTVLTAPLASSFGPTLPETSVAPVAIHALPLSYSMVLFDELMNNRPTLPAEGLAAAAPTMYLCSPLSQCSRPKDSLVAARVFRISSSPNDTGSVSSGLVSSRLSKPISPPLLGRPNGRLAVRILETVRFFPRRKLGLNDLFLRRRFFPLLEGFPALLDRHCDDHLVPLTC